MPPREDVPLLTSSTQTGNGKLVIKRETELWMSEDEDDGDEALLSENKKKRTSLIITDAVILVIQLLQLYCVLFSLSLRWTWPLNWLKYTRWILFINLDLWDFLKLNTNGTYTSIQGYHTPSTALPIAYWLLLLIWGLIIFTGLLVYIIVYACIRSTHHPHLMVRIAKLQRVYLILFQVLAIPFGVVVGRIFHCNNTGYVDVDNNLFCLLDHHWAYITPTVALAVLCYLVLPIWMIFRTRTELLSMPADRHEAYLQLKETEYSHGMDVGWIVGHFHIFSSFKKHGAYFRPALFFCFLVILILYAVVHNHLQIQAISICSFILILFITFVFVRPFRVGCFNAFLCFSLLVLTVDGLMGALLASSTPTTITSVWLLPSYQLYVLASVNSLWFFVIIVFLVYTISRHVACCKRCCKCCRTPLWPVLTSNKIYKLSPNTRKYVKAILKGRVLMDKILEMPPLFAPAHELGRQIHIINAYCREAEFLKDPIQNSLWDLLDELIDAHSRVAPKSLFAESVKDSIRSTAAELMRMMPVFTRRLAQREYDFLLMRPVKRRMLLKMYCMGLFLNNRRDSTARQRLTVPYLQKVWKPIAIKHEIEELPDDGYYEDMYPEYETVDPHVYRPETAVAMDLIAFEETQRIETVDEEVVLDDAEKWAKEHPLTPLTIRPITATTYTNLVFENDELSSEEGNMPRLITSPAPSDDSERAINNSPRALFEIGEDNRSYSGEATPMEPSTSYDNGRTFTPEPRNVHSPSPTPEPRHVHSPSPSRTVTNDVEVQDIEEIDPTDDRPQSQSSHHEQSPRQQEGHVNQAFASHEDYPDQQESSDNTQSNEQDNSKIELTKASTNNEVAIETGDKPVSPEPPPTADPDTSVEGPENNDNTEGVNSTQPVEAGENSEQNSEGVKPKGVTFDNKVQVMSSDGEVDNQPDDDEVPKDFAV